MLYNFAKFLVFLYYSLFHRVKIKGRENIPKKGGVLLYANHPSTLDMVLIGAFCSRPVHYMAKAELFKNPIIGFFLKKLGAFPVKRGKGDVGSVKNVFKLLEEGKVVGVFPEGTRTPKRDPNKRKAGAAMMALHSNAPILPVGVIYRKKLFSTLEVVFGEPFKLEPRTKGEHPSKEELLEGTQYIMDKIYALIGQ
jgi:1-acyl-sn-glycerol-3-phosphate acyltransferase